MNRINNQSSKFLFAVLTALSFFCGQLLHPNSAWANSLEITTGDRDSTYFEFGQNIKNAAEKYGIGIRIRTSDGSIANLDCLFIERSVDLAFVQQDFLTFVKKNQGDEGINERYDGYVGDIKLVERLFPEEVHLIAKKGSEVQNFSDLRNSNIRFSVGPKFSGTYVTALNILRAAGISRDRSENLKFNEAIESLINDEIHAVFQVVGFPDSRLNEHKYKDKLTLIEIPFKDTGFKFGKEYMEREIFGKFSGRNNNYYPWLEKNTVKTIGVHAVLMTFNYTKETSPEKCNLVGKVSGLIRKNLEWFQDENSNNHPKWKDVIPEDSKDSDGPVEFWNEPLECVSEWRKSFESEIDHISDIPDNTKRRDIVEECRRVNQCSDPANLDPLLCAECDHSKQIGFCEPSY